MNIKTITYSKAFEEILSPKEFLNLTAEDRANISHTEVIPPLLGQRDFGKIKVHYKRLAYKRKGYFNSCGTDLIF